MARTVDPQRHRARRLQILDAAITCFARSGYERTTTAAVCREAGIGSGTLFHYFPTKAALLVGILELDAEETREAFARVAGDDPWSALEAVVRRAAEEVSDPRVPGFVAAVLGVMGEPAVADALAASDEATKAGLRDLLARAQRAGAVRTDLPPERLAGWVALVLDGFTSQLATDAAFDARVEGGVLLDVVARVVRPA